MIWLIGSPTQNAKAITAARVLHKNFANPARKVRSNSLTFQRWFVLIFCSSRIQPGPIIGFRPSRRFIEFNSSGTHPCRSERDKIEARLRKKRELTTSFIGVFSSGLSFGRKNHSRRSQPRSKRSQQQSLEGFHFRYFLIKAIKSVPAETGVTAISGLMRCPGA